MLLIVVYNKVKIELLLKMLNFHDQNEEKFLNGFRNNVAYVKLLAELELLKEPSSKSDDEDTGSVDELSLGSETASLSSLTLDLRDGMSFFNLGCCFLRINC